MAAGRASLTLLRSVTEPSAGARRPAVMTGCGNFCVGGDAAH